MVFLKDIFGKFRKKEEAKPMTLGERMKMYEEASSGECCADPRCPVVIRLDGKSFHTWVKKAKLVKPFDQRMLDAMQTTALRLCEEISSAVMAYVESDEITLVLRNDQSDDSEPWFGNRLQKLCSLSASICTAYFNTRMAELTDSEAPLAFFDSRVIYMPSKEEVFNNILWRQNDCIKNSISGLALANFSDKELSGKNGDERKQMLLEKGVNWDDLSTDKKYGALVHYRKTVGEYNGTEFTRMSLFVDTEFGRADFDKLDKAYNFRVKEDD